MNSVDSNSPEALAKEREEQNMEPIGTQNHQKYNGDDMPVDTEILNGLFDAGFTYLNAEEGEGDTYADALEPTPMQEQQQPQQNNTALFIPHVSFLHQPQPTEPQTETTLERLFQQSQRALMEANLPVNTANPTPEDLDRMLASDLAKLSMKQREQAMEDLHGILPKFEEEEKPENLKALLQKMQQHLDSMQWLPSSAAYRRAVEMNPAFVQERRILFLRADRYQPPEAAQRMIKFFQLKLELWGSAKLCKRITIVDDFSDIDLKALKQAFLSICPYTDSSKRKIFYTSASLERVKDINSQLRAQWYTFMSAVEDDEDTQRRGVVFISLDVPPDYKAVGIELRDTIPVFFASMHGHVRALPETLTIITNEGVNVVPTRKTEPTAIVSKAPVIMKQAATNMSLRQRVRTKFYLSTREEALRQMMTYGIPMAAAPFTIDGSYDMQRHLQWVDRCIELETRSKEAAASLPLSNIAIRRASSPTPSEITNGSSPSTALIPDSDIKDSDVLFGKEKKVVNHPGNAQFRQLIDMYLPSYESAPRGEKNNITKVIVDHVRGNSGRFLKRGPNKSTSKMNGAGCSTMNHIISNGGGGADGWVEVTTEVAHDKITHAFRNRRKHHSKSTQPVGA